LDQSPGSGPSLCAQEPIHSPGAIQPHGAMLAVLAESLLVTHASANLAALLGRPADSVLGRRLAEVIGEAACRALNTAMPRDGALPLQVHILARPDGGALDLRTYRSGRHICIDIEPIRREPQERSSIILAQSILETFKHTATCAELCEFAVVGLRAISGFDRVMAYRFHEDGHGEVIAEARAAQLEPYLGLHYPASDVPPQARRLYLTQRVGAIADSDYRPVPLLVDPVMDDGTSLDLTHSCLRSVSPIHRAYMRNMKTAASLTIGLAHGSDLWGMLVCHHTQPRIASPELRAVADMVGQVVSLLLGSLGEAEVYAQRFRRHATLRALVDRLEQPTPLAQALAAGGAELIALTTAAGAIVRISGKFFCLGNTPPQPEAESALALLYLLANGNVLAVDDLGLRHPELARCTAEGSGALLLPLAQDTDDAILWFRPEQSRTVAWGGNPAEHGALDPVTKQLSPRASFAAWKEAVRGHSAPWTEADLTLARAVRSAVEAAVAQRTKADLAKLRHYDVLTGLPNRSLLEERLRDIRHEADRPTSLLFLDLDGFKAVNDTMGHAAGDALLIEVARRLLDAAGPDSLVARLGGDEFVVLCPGLDRGAIAVLGERVRLAIETPIETTGRPCNVFSSIGIAVADETGGLDLVRAADMAMYAAKQAGGNRAVVYEPSLFDRVSMRFELEQDMREALSRGDEFVLLYQPLFRIGSGTRRLAGFEALVRWQHPRHGWLSPGTFIPLAEKSGLILPLGDWVLATALRHGRAMRDAYPEANLIMNVNVSALQLPQSGYCSGIAGALEAEGYPPAALCLEVVESLLANATAATVLADVRKLGVTVAIDDFGIGYSSLSYLRRLPVDKVKLDRSFLEDMEGDPNGVRFVTAVVALAHAAGKPVVFEGIETMAQFHIALATGADMVQGFFFAPPLSANAAAELVAQRRQLDARQPSVVPPARDPKVSSDPNEGGQAELRLALIAREASNARDELSREFLRRAATESALRESEERFRLLLHSNVTEALYLLDPDGNVETWNASAERIKGYTADEVIGRNFSMFFAPEDVASGEPAHILATARDNGHFETDAWRVRKDGSRFLARVAIDAIRRVDGSLRGFAKVTLDITNHRIEEAQRAIIIEAAPNGMMVVDEAGIITLANSRVERIFDYPHGTLIGQSVEILVPEKSRVAHGALRSAFTSGRSDQAMAPQRQFTGCKRDGSAVTIEIMINPVSTPRGRIVVASLFDVTNRIRQAGDG
jgi:diguanylate cyclase (GGDEF)-like protein/PAS domain S-box-containing protein